MINLNTSIAAVTVYPDRARITRSGSLPLEVGTSSLEISELPLNLNPDSIRVSAHGTASARLSGVQLSRSFYSEAPSEKVRQLEMEIEKFQDEIKRLDTQADLLKQNRANLDLLSAQATVYATAIAAGEITIEQQLALFEGLRKQVEKLNGEAQIIQVNRRDTDRRLQKLNKVLEQYRNAQPRERYTAIVEVDIKKAGDLTIEISYLVNQAAWIPLYDLCLLEKNNYPLVEVGYLAQVTQNTSENWNDVSLTLSTARPALTGKLPELDPWFINVPEPIIPLARATLTPQLLSSMKAAPAISAQPALEPPAEEDAEEITATVDQSNVAITYGVPGMITIPPDNSPHKVVITRFPLTPRLDYISAPKLIEGVYRRAKVDNDSTYTLLPGSANIFIGDEYIGSTPLELTVPQGEFEINLGIEDRFKVERKLKRRDADKRFIGGKRHLEFGYEIKLENLLAINASITLLDQIPVSFHEEVKVNLESIDPVPTERTELNMLKWELTLEPNESLTLHYDFSVESPQGMTVIGLS